MSPIRRFPSSRFRLADLVLLSLSFALFACGDRQNEVSNEALEARAESGADESSLRTALGEQLDRYEEAMDELIALLDSSDDAVRIESATRELIGLSLPLLEGLPVLQPSCAEYLTAAAKLVEVLDEIGEEEIEEGFHKDGALPATDSALCYHVKDLLVHPATVIVLLREEGLAARREDMKAEILENRAHLGAVRAALDTGS